MRKFTGCVVLAALVGACSSSAPVAIRAGDVCYRCRRVIADPAVAAESVGPSGMAVTFRTAGCLARYLAEQPEENGALFVTDYASRKLVAARSAVFVATFNRDTGERDYIAYTKSPAADAAALDRHTTLVDWNSVLDAARKAAQGN